MKINILGIMHPMFGKFLSSGAIKSFIPREYLINPEYSMYEEHLQQCDPEKLAEINRIKIVNLQDFIKQYVGTIGGECYSTKGMEYLATQPVRNAMNRAEKCFSNMHNSIAGHFKVTLELVDVPKALCMLINDNRLGNSSEKSGRYTNMAESGTEEDKRLYEKYYKIFYDKIANTYGKKYPKIFDHSTIDKKAKENARYPISTYAKTNLVVTNDPREFTGMYNAIEKILAQGENMHPFYKPMENELREFNKLLKGTGVVLDEMKSKYDYEFNLISPNNEIIIPQYGYSIDDVYKLSLASVAQKHRARYDDISVAFDDDPEYVVPEIIEDDKDLVQEYLKDCKSQKQRLPQATLVNVNEIIPAKYLARIFSERLCFAAQLEICKSCLAQIQRILKNLDPKYIKIRQELEKIKGAYCTWGGICPSPCGFKEGIDCTRKI